MSYLRVVLHKAIWVINYKWTVLFDDWLKSCVLCKRHGLENKPKVIQEKTEWGMLVAWGALLCEMPVPESGWQNLEDRRYHQGFGETPVDLSMELSRDQLNVCIPVCVCWLKACSRVVLRCKGRHMCRRGCVLSLSARMWLVHFSAGPHLCLHASVPPLSHRGAAAPSPVSFWGSEWLAFEEYSGGLSGMFCVTPESSGGSDHYG